jgi:hypothetical protein
LEKIWVRATDASLHLGGRRRSANMPAAFCRCNPGETKMLRPRSRIDGPSLGAILAFATVSGLLTGCGQTGSPPRTDAENPPPATAGPPVEVSAPLVSIDGSGRVDASLQGTHVVLQAVPDFGWMFAGWVGIGSNANPVSIIPSEQAAIGARFVPIPNLSVDGDGIPDEIDLCLGTRPGASVDADGCALDQRDSDGDGITDDLDQCPSTPRSAQINSVGCAASQLDDDYDGLPNNVDYCPGTPFREVVNVLGCSLSQFDTDLDGVLNPFDLCPDTSYGAAVNYNGCAPGQPGYEVSPNDECSAGECENSQAACGNGLVESGEECDPPNGTTCDENCQLLGSCNASGPGSSTWSSTQRLFYGAGVAPNDGYSTPEVYEFDATGSCILARVIPNVPAITAATNGSVTVVDTEIPVPAPPTIIFVVESAESDNVHEKAQISYYNLAYANPGGEAFLSYCYRLIDEYAPHDGSNAIEYSFWGALLGSVSQDGNTITWTTVSAGGLAAEINGTWTRTCAP